MQITKNVFQSLSMDLDVSQVKPNHMIYNEGFTVFAKENKNWILTNIKGNDLVSDITEGFVPVCIEVYSGIAYIISAEVTNGIPTGKGEIGTFPSPDYGNSSDLKMEYAPLLNYYGDLEDGLIKPMRSDHFGFTLEKPFSMVLEKDYDGTVNIIWTDGVNPMRIINSRFSVRDDFSYEIIDRQGIKDTNIYHKEDFDTIINLVSTVSRIMKVSFEGLLQGGRMLTGNYRYYFRLETEDSNLSEVVGESGLVSVFHGDSPGNTRGGGGEGLETDKSASFVLENVDDSYRFVKVFFVHSTGEEEPVERAFTIDQRYPIEGGIVRFNHLGTEQLIPIDISTLNVESQPIDTVGTIAKAGGYILAGDVTEKVIDYQSLVDFSRKITLRHTDKKLHTYGKTDNGSDLSVKNEQASLSVGSDGYNNGYINPKNIYERLGYSSGESYPFGVRFILPGGSLTPTFPVMGTDNVNGGNIYPDEQDIDALIDQLTSQHQGFRESDGHNIKGIYRFPNNQSIFDGEYLSIQGVKFKIPDIPQSVKDATIGIQFMRGESNQDRITQGVFYNTMPIPVDQYTEVGNTRGWRLYDYLYEGARYTIQTAKWIPTYNYQLESFGVWESRNGIGRKNDRAGNGIIPIKFTLHGTRDLNRSKMFAFISPEIQSVPSRTISKLNNRDVKLKVKGSIRSYFDAPTKTYNDNSTYSLIRQKSMYNLFLAEYDAKASWVVGGDNGPNNDRFAGGCYFQAYVDTEFPMFNLKYNDYVGLLFKEGDIHLGEYSTAPTGNAGEVNYNTQGQEKDDSIFTDIYPEFGQRNTEQLKSIYANLNAITYFPLSERFYWDQSEDDAIENLSLEDRIDVNREIELYGGDNYTGPHYRRLYVNGFGYYGQANFSEFEGASSIGETMMYFAESKVNSAIRGEHTFDVSEYRARSFYPYEAGKKPFAIGNNFGSGNPWREYRLMETNNYNHGHRKNMFGKLSISFPTDSPYIATRRRARIMHSRKFTSNSFNNELRVWEGLNFQDYDSSLGRIVRMGILGDRVVIIQEKGTSYIRLEERIAAGNDSAGPVFFEAAGVLPPRANHLALMGTTWPESVLFTELGVYGFDNDSQYIWRYDYKRVEPISKLSIDSHLFKYLKEFKRKGYGVLGDYHISVSRNSNNEEILFTFRQPVNPFTVVFSELTQEFVGFHPFIPEKGFSIDRNYFTTKFTKSIYQHNLDIVPRGFFYGQQQKFKISFVVNEGVDLEKVFVLMDIMSNRVFPDKITFRVPGAKSEESIIYSGPIYDVNAKFLKNKIAVSIPKIKEVTDNDATEYGLSVISNNDSSLEVDSRIRGHLMVVDLEYSDSNSIVIKSVLTYFNIS